MIEVGRHARAADSVELARVGSIMLMRWRSWKRKNATPANRPSQDEEWRRADGFLSFLADVVGDNQTTLRFICVPLAVAVGTSLIIGSIAVPLIVIAFRASTVAGVGAVCGSVATVATAVATAVVGLVRQARRHARRRD